MAKLQVTELDFDDIKENLKTYLKAQTKFKDYDFEGSGMNVLLDTLAYNTHYLAFNANMVANEMFLDSASLRSSVVSHAKQLGYEVSSSRAPIATITAVVTTTSDTITMPAGTKFNTTIDGQSFSFVTIADVTKAKSGGVVTFDDTLVYEGTYVTVEYTVDSSDVTQRFLLTDDRADVNTLTVQVQNSVSDTETTTYTKATDISQLTSSSAVYFLQEVEAGKFEVYFGDGVLSKSITDGNIITLKYVVTNKTAANGASTFTAPSSIAGETGIVVTTDAAAVGGAEPESIDSIKLKAPLDFASQGRAVSTKDYEVYVKKLFPQTQSVSVWGGEDGSYDTSTGSSSVAEYGKVFISIKSNSGQKLTSVQKTNLVSALAPFKVASVTPVIVDAETVSLILGTTFRYDTTATSLAATDLIAKVNTVIQNYNTNNLQLFTNPFRHSELLGLIDAADTSILSNVTTVTMAQNFTPTLGTAQSFNLNFANPFFNPHDGHNSAAGGIIASTGFGLNDDGTTEYFFDDDGSGNLRIYSLSGLTRVYFNNFAGTVDYTNGLISIGSLNITSISDVDGDTSTQIRVTVLPASNDIVPVRNQIIEIDLINTTISAAVDLTASTGKGYTTTQTGTSSTTTTTGTTTSTSTSTTTTTVSTTSSTPTSSAY